MDVGAGEGDDGVAAVGVALGVAAAVDVAPCEGVAR